MRALAWLVLVGCAHAWAAVSEIPKDTNYVLRHNASCSTSGFFFLKESGPNLLDPDICYLCFCRNNDTAVCWRRENTGCDLDHYQDFGDRNSRSRRSPLSFGEVFVRDAARDFFNKQSPEQCKPFESSFSDGCPPADWCIGCTVCDCDANGRWDCHVLSFCTDKTGKKQMKKRRGQPRSRISKRQSKTSTTNTARSTKVTTKPPKKPTRKRSVNNNMKRNQVKQSAATNKRNVNQVKTSNVNKMTPVKKPLPKLQAKKGIPSRNKVTKRPLYIKRNVSTNKPLNIKSTNDKSVKNNTVEVAQKVVKQFLTTMQKMMKNIDLKTNMTTKQVNKVVKKRSMSKQDHKSSTKDIKKKQSSTPKHVLNVNKKKSGTRNTSKSPNSTTSTNIRSRKKRQATIVEERNATKWNDVNKTDDNGKGNRTQNSQINNNSANFILNITHMLSNNTANYIQLKNTMDRDFYVTDNHIHINNQNLLKDGATQIYNFNKTDSTRSWIFNNNNISSNTVEDVILLTSDRSYVSTNFTGLNNMINNRTDFITKLPEEIKNPINLKYKIEKKYSNVSTQTENRRCTFRTLLQKLIGSDTDQYNTTEHFKTSKKPKRFTILSKIKRLFKKILNIRNKNNLNYKDDLYYSNFKLKGHDYKISEKCKIGRIEKEKLGKMIKELKSESENILKTVRIIKGLLHLLEINTNGSQYKLSGNLYGSNDDVNKLSAIVKNTYDTGENIKKLTEDQRTQINYIKDNVQVFIKSIGKFARILDDLIKIAMCHNKKESKINNVRVNENNNMNHSKVKEYKGTTNIKLDKLKRLIWDYNILQKKFIHEIYVILNNLNAKTTDKNILKPILRGEDYTKDNKKDVIETNSANIIKNIKKLKLLAERINPQRRRKRESIDDEDALEYLLILMEYLLKRHSPAYPPVNDGIDLLIEAIKSAPDNKLTRKKVLHNITERAFVTRTTIPINMYKKSSDYPTSNKVEEQKNYSTKTDNIKMKTTIPSEDEEVDEDKIEEIYRSFKSNRYVNSEQKQDDTSLGGHRVSNISDSFYNVREESTTQINRNRDNEVLAYKAARDPLDEEVTTTSNTAISNTIEMDTTSVSPSTDHGNVRNVNPKKQVKPSTSTDKLIVDTQANIEWIEENFKELKQSRGVNDKPSTPKSLTATRTPKRTDNNVSDISNENMIYNEKRVGKTSAEEIMSKKQLDLLNSLDYVEDEVDSKDDKFLSDAYV